MLKTTVGKPLEKALDIIGEILAFIVILVLAFSYINTVFEITDHALLLTILGYVQTYATIAVVAVVGLEFVIDKGLILTIIYLALVAVVLIFSFMPAVQEELLAFIKK
ncbi:MAG TPA: hypothetical protein GX745_06530 [Clostridiales bacterium]|jgi:hypothetical protein|nr:hypothetical protein [Clostridiales bacterium]